MAFTLVVNPGSSSKKYALYTGQRVVCSQRFERTEAGFELCTEHNGTRQKCEGITPDTFKSALETFLDFATSAVLPEGLSDITAVAVRVVVPGSRFQRHEVITDAYIAHLRELEKTAPLHIPHILKEILVVQKIVPQATLVAASDSAFHSTMPVKARSYSLPTATCVEYDLYRFGYHGLSVASVVRRHASVFGQVQSRLAVCHLGSGVSVTAVKDGLSVETSMGYAPGTGALMGTRAGDADVGVLLSLMRSKNITPLEAQIYLQTMGGLYGVAGEADLRIVIERAAQGEAVAVTALDMYVYHIARCIAVATVALGGLDALVFTATAGERSSYIRARVCDQLAHLRVVLDEEKNELALSKDVRIDAVESVVRIGVIKTDEMGEMNRVVQTVV